MMRNRLAKLKARAPSRDELPKQLAVFRNAKALMRRNDVRWLGRQIDLTRTAAVVSREEWQRPSIRKAFGHFLQAWPREDGRLLIQLSLRVQLDFAKRVAAMVAPHFPHQPHQN